MEHPQTYLAKDRFIIAFFFLSVNPKIGISGFHHKIKRYVGFSSRSCPKFSKFIIPSPYHFHSLLPHHFRPAEFHDHRPNTISSVP